MCETLNLNTIRKKGVNKGIVRHKYSKYSISTLTFNLENMPTVFDSFKQSSLT